MVGRRVKCFRFLPDRGWRLDGRLTDSFHGLPAASTVSYLNIIKLLSILSDWLIDDGAFTPFDVPFRKIFKLKNKEIV